MIIAYVQADERQGLVGALDGRPVSNELSRFVDAREEGRLAAHASPIQVGAVEVRYAQGIVRLVFNERRDASYLSPVTVVIGMSAAGTDVARISELASQSVRAIGVRDVPDSLGDAIRTATELHASSSAKRRALIVGAIALGAIALIAAGVIVAISVSSS